MTRNKNSNARTLGSSIKTRETDITCLCQYCGKEYLAQEIYCPPLKKWLVNTSCDCEEYKEAEQRKSDEEMYQLVRENRKKAQAERMSRNAKASGIKRRFQNRTFENFKSETPQQEAAKKLTMRYVQTFPERLEQGQGLYIDGKYGTGKTHLAAAITINLLLKGHRVICKTFNDILLDIQDGFSGATSTLEQIKPYLDCDLLVIDDLGKEKGTEWSLSILYNMLNNRYEDMKPVIITTNYGFEELITALSPNGDNDNIRSIVSRIKETSWQLTMVGNDYRETALRNPKSFRQDQDKAEIFHDVFEVN